MSSRSMSPVLRPLVLRLVVSLVLVTVLVVINFSYPLAEWWGTHFSFFGRPSTGEMDTHVALWFMISISGVWVVSAWRDRKRRARTLLALFGASLVIEWLQPQLTLRTFQWSDVAGNFVGVSVAGLMMAAWDRGYFRSLMSDLPQ